MLVFAVVVLVIGVLLIAGPTLLAFVLTALTCFGSSAIASEMKIYMMGALLLGVILNRIYQRSEVFKTDASEVKEKKRKRHRRVSKLLKIYDIVVFVSLVILALNQVLGSACTAWNELMVKNQETFSSMRGIGIAIVCLCLAYFAGYFSRKQKRIINLSTEDLGSDSGENAEMPIGVLDNPDCNPWDGPDIDVPGDGKRKGK